MGVIDSKIHEERKQEVPVPRVECREDIRGYGCGGQFRKETA